MRAILQVRGQRLRRAVCGALVFVSALLSCAGASAGAPDEAAPAEVQALVEKARTLVAARNIAQAIVLYEQLYAETRDTRYIYNIGYLYEDAGQPAVAWDHYQRYLLAAPGGAKATELKKYLDELADKLGERFRLVHVISTPPGASVTVTTEGAVRHPPGVTPMSLWMPLGAAGVRCELAGFAPTDKPLQVDGTGSLRLLVLLEAIPVEPPIEVEGPGDETPQPPPGGDQVSSKPVESVDAAVSTESPWATIPLATWISGGVAVAALASAIGTQVVAGGKSDEASAMAPQLAEEDDAFYYDWVELGDEAKSYQMAANVTFGIAAAAFATGLTYYLVEALGASEVETPIIAPVVTDGGFGVLAGWRL